MLGQGSGLNNRIRKLVARIQREFQFPRVTSVKCHIHASARVWRDPTQVALHRLTPPPVVLHELTAEMEVETIRAALGGTACNRMMTLEEITTATHQVICWQQNRFPINRPALMMPSLRTTPFPTRIPLPITQRPAFKLPGFKIHRTPFRPTTVIRKNTELAQTFPMCLLIQPMKSLPMKIQIRHRASVLSSLGLKPAQVRFTGVVRNLPPIPLRLMDVATDAASDTALARIVGPHNPMLGRRVWVIVYHLEKHRYIPITLKEE